MKQGCWELQNTYISLNIPTAVNSIPCHVVWYRGTNVLEQPAVSIFKAEDEGTMLLKNVTSKEHPTLPRSV
jgi:hypothetical protein